MASPQSTTSHEDDGQAQTNLEQITFRFCAECSNMLYPKEDEVSHKLQFTCRTCQYTEEAISTCVFRNVLNNAAGETAGVTQDVGSDPTVGDSHAPASVSTPASNTYSPFEAVVCLCCGAVIACRSCGELFCKPLLQSSSTAPTTTTTATATAKSTTAMADAADFSVEVCTLEDLDLYPDDRDLIDVCCDDCDYEFMNGTEYGNRDNMAEAVVV
ncbi:hypothetical protein SEPCBS57363_003136 [Sporothrix epigloea]|uniref:DNA-directed RNA polymerase II subunit RPB9-like zinc ribbon domain-containing protein n=1 Tax=Sporothrix epigloea TaxID=1892477 RepID=A0ABP0DJZ9_9PEZI